MDLPILSPVRDLLSSRTWNGFQAYGYSAKLPGMATKVRLDFVPMTGYVACCTSTASKRVTLLYQTDFVRAETKKLDCFLDCWGRTNENIRLMDCLFIRFKNQLHHFKFFQAFCCFRRSIKHLCSGVQRSGVSRLRRLSENADSNTVCPNVHSVDHFLVCLIQLHHFAQLAIRRSVSCWRICDLQFATGHFTKILLLMMTLLASFRPVLERSASSLNLTYENIKRVRDGLCTEATWLPTDITLPSSLNSIDQTENNRLETAEIDQPVREQSLLHPSASLCATTTSHPQFEASLMQRSKKAKKKALNKQLLRDFSALRAPPGPT
ncbi:hypothetical protein X801_01305, partial [Opisthorchis viverrini]